MVAAPTTAEHGAEDVRILEGSIGKQLGAFEVQGATLIDWEAISTYDSGNLYLADIWADGIART